MDALALCPDQVADASDTELFTRLFEAGVPSVRGEYLLSLLAGAAAPEQSEFAPAFAASAERRTRRR
jgi:hypothetical protein